MDEYKYPLAGQKNTTFEVWIASISMGNNADGSSISVKKTNIFPRLSELFPWCECIYFYALPIAFEFPPILCALDGCRLETACGYNFLIDFSSASP